MRSFVYFLWLVIDFSRCNAAFFDAKFQFLIKPVNIDALQDLILPIYEQHIPKYVIIKSQEVLLSDILYFEISSEKRRRVNIILKSGVISCSGKLTDLLNALPSTHFVRCHQSFAININNTNKITKNIAVLADGIELDITRTYREDVRKAFMRKLHARSAGAIR
ncbi:MAG: LytTR family transcriptional regulator [Oscillospiraceae bacterium]|nr:LytTR family transcriptional regulator [Oscillospiraceae bacterium]